MEDVALRFRGEPSSAKGKSFGHTEGKVVFPPVKTPVWTLACVARSERHCPLANEMQRRTL